MNPVTLEELAKYECPDLSAYALMMTPGTVANNAGRGDTIDVSKLLENYHAALLDVIAKLTSGEALPSDYELWVPDLWHVTHGDASSLPPQDAEAVWQSQVIGVRIGETFMQRASADARDGYPGSLFRS